MDTLKEKYEDKYEINTKITKHENTERKKQSKQPIYKNTIVPAEFEKVLVRWLTYKKEKNQTYRSQIAIDMCLKKLLEYSNNDPKIAEEIIEESISKNYTGFFELKKHNTNPTKDTLQKPLNTKYAEELKHPLWQKKRLKIMQRDNFTCQNCDDKESTLHVHHLIYLPKEDYPNPWDYPDTLLITLCDTCHKEEHTYKTILQEALLVYSAIKSYHTGKHTFSAVDLSYNLYLLEQTERDDILHILKEIINSKNINTIKQVH
jgi:5-methylcytosine-specific restriction endonuclease McrA